jgi:hypothetical protein
VNWQPWSVLKISVTPCSAIARSTAVTQKLASRVFDRPYPWTARLYQSITAQR